MLGRPWIAKVSCLITFGFTQLRSSIFYITIRCTPSSNVVLGRADDRSLVVIVSNRYYNRLVFLEDKKEKQMLEVG